MTGAGPSHEEIVISAIRKTLTATAVVTAVLTGAVACGTAENLSAGQKLDRAFDKLGKEHSASFELDLDADATTLKALDKGAAPGDEMPDQVAKLLADARISLSVQSKKPLDESGEKDITGMTVKVSSTDADLIEYRIVGDYAYLHANASALAAQTGSPLPAAEDLPESATAFKHLLNGKWIKVPAKDLKSGVTGPQTPQTTPDADTQNKLSKALRGVITRQVELKNEGEKDGADHITATASVRTLLSELLKEVRPFTKDLPPGATLPSDNDLKKVPDQKVTADFALKNGKLSEVSLDLAKLTQNAKVTKLALVLRVAKAEPTTAPAGAVEVPMAELVQGFTGAPAPDGQSPAL
ncbi:hypothetical protein ACFYMW_35975 [Streptomyces sp. NPDC006692]|uniref:hypothetical protein n=1 Tax=unclassified Streptomyces TaxID=2593676 RepID=UPI00343B7A2F